MVTLRVVEAELIGNASMVSVQQVGLWDHKISEPVNLFHKPALHCFRRWSGVGVRIGVSIRNYCRNVLAGAAAFQQLQRGTCSLHVVKLVGSGEHGGLCYTPSLFFS